MFCFWKREHFCELLENAENWWQEGCVLPYTLQSFAPLLGVISFIISNKISATGNFYYLLV